MSGLCVLATSRVPPGIRGSLNQWMIEVLPGIFVGRPSSRVRDGLWEELSAALPLREAYAVLVHQSNEEQGFSVSRVGDHRYEVIDMLGLQLVKVRHRSMGGDEQLEALPDPTW